MNICFAFSEPLKYAYDSVNKQQKDRAFLQIKKKPSGQKFLGREREYVRGKEQVQ
jgi:hypothetical protein